MLGMSNGKPAIRRATLLVVAALALVGCAASEQDRPPIGAGAAVGAVSAGALAGVALRNQGPVVATAGVIGAGLLGGYLGDRYIDQPRAAENSAAREAAAEAAMRRRLDHERQSALQAEKTRRKIEAQGAKDRLKAGAGDSPASAGRADVRGAQRYLTALGYYRGPLDGIYGPRTRSGVIQFERSEGLPPTGELTPAIVERMRAAI